MQPNTIFQQKKCQDLWPDKGGKKTFGKPKEKKNKMFGGTREFASSRAQHAGGEEKQNTI